MMTYRDGEFTISENKKVVKKYLSNILINNINCHMINNLSEDKTNNLGPYIIYTNYYLNKYICG